ncbi:MAG: Hsp20/alpha crystallin family protein [Bacteroidota bacterium]|nr:Hsp20/alpha crystallin family protein [Bacteroidota bacterium]MDP4229655.1 Hsp20/alpha crystallin family protein [Bacteroidota bacterium]MDP4236903.1 Hsp20/alpha crystallin family protein [Bacteroidota bacterium]
MSLITFDPWRSLDRVETDMRRFLGNLGTAFPSTMSFDGMYVPRADVFEDEGNLYITAELPGMSKNDVKVTLADHTLTIQGKKERKEEKKGKNFHQIERSFGEFVREFGIPETCKEDQVHAEFENGILEISIPKIKSEKLKEKVKEIPIASGKKSLVTS